MVQIQAVYTAMTENAAELVLQSGERGAGGWLLRKSFVMHSGALSDFKIECDALTDEEIETFAMLIAKRFKFSYVEGVPRGGLRIAAALEKYRYRNLNRWLIVDDVLTTGASMEKYRGSSRDIGVVLFARGPCPEWVHPVFRLWD